MGKNEAQPSNILSNYCIQ